MTSSTVGTGLFLIEMVYCWRLVSTMDSRVTVEDSSTLTIVDVGVSDEGHYTCFVSFNGTDAGESTAILSTRGGNERM